MSDELNKEEALFHEALSKPSVSERAAFLDAVCQGDEELRARLEMLLRGHFQNRFLSDENPQGRLPLTENPGQTTGGTAILPVTEQPGDHIGRYKLLEKIGEGGWGVVYLAEQEEPVRRRVALKVIKVGMDTRDFIARFEAERQALALMDHPNIARVFDGGATETGRPYFVMELVRGIKLTEFCDQDQLSVPERLGLFLQVCQAVQHAHQKGVIHRDLKPSNILVTVNDGVPVPKVIDFGIAKATGPKLTDKTLVTGFHAMIGTPAYMSPEQAEMTSLDIDTRSDIYALGVLLYELFTGKTPFALNELLQAGFDEMRRTIREKEPMRPSTRLRLMQDAERTTTAERRRTEAPRLIHIVSGDLDWIVMKCLEKDRTRRYETATGLAQDLQRYLNHEPVLARPPSAVYRWQKFVRKYRTGVAVAAGFVLLLTAATVVSTFLAFWANQERARARKAQQAEARQREQAERTETIAKSNERKAQAAEADTRAVLHFFEDNVLAAARPKGSEKGLGKDATLRAAVDHALIGLDNVFTNRPRVEASIRSVLANTYRALGDSPAALQQAEKAVELNRAHARSGLHANLDDLNNLAVLYRDVGRSAKALTLLEELVVRYKESLGTNDRGTLLAMNNLALAYKDAGRLTNALPLFEEVLRRQQDQFGPGNRDTLITMNNLADAYDQAGRLADGLRLYEAMLPLVRVHLPPEDVLTLSVLNNLAMDYRATGRRSKALPLMEEAVRVAQTNLGSSHPQTTVLLDNLAKAYGEASRPDAAIRLLRDALAEHSATIGETNAPTLKLMARLADAYRATTDLTNALMLFRRTLKLRSEHLGASHRQTLDTVVELAITCLRARRAAEAESVLRQYLPIIREQSPTGWRLREAQILLGCSRFAQKEYADAESLLLEGYRGLKERPDQVPSKVLSNRTKEAARHLSLLYADQNKTNEAAAWKQTLAELNKGAPPNPAE